MNLSVVVFRLLSGVSCAFYVAAAVFLLSGAKKKAGYALWGVAAAVNTALVALNWLHNGYAPIVSMYQVLSFLALCSLFAHLYMKLLRGVDFGGCFAAVSAVLLIGVTAMNGAAAHSFPPALRSPFFIPHIICYLTSYTLDAVAALSAAKHKDGAVECVRAGFPFMTAGLFLGSLWANEVWGAFWSWDVKECWSLACWLCFACVLHFNSHARLKKFVPVMIYLGMTLVLVTLFAVNMMNVASPHTYA